MSIKKKAAKAKKAKKTTKTTAAKKSVAKRTTSARKSPAAKKASATKAKTKTKAKATSRKAKPAKVTKTKATRKTVAKKSAAKTAPARKADSLKLPSTAIAQKQSKAQIYTEISELTELNKNDVKKVFTVLKNLVERNVKTKGSGQFTIPELGIKVRRVQKKATKARMGRNPFTGEDIKIPAKPARKSVRASALKSLKELI